MTRPLKAPNEILRAALEKETQARDFYLKLEANCSVDFVKELLKRLQNEESKHMHLIQEMIEKLEAGQSIV